MKVTQHGDGERNTDTAYETDDGAHYTYLHQPHSE